MCLRVCVRVYGCACRGRCEFILLARELSMNMRSSGRFLPRLCVRAVVLIFQDWNPRGRKISDELSLPVWRGWYVCG